MIQNLENKMKKMQESINKDLEELKDKHAETNNTITEIKNTLEGINSRIFLSSVIVLFVSVCLFFNSSRSLLIDSCFFPFCFQGF